LSSDVLPVCHDGHIPYAKADVDTCASNALLRQFLGSDGNVGHGTKAWTQQHPITMNQSSAEIHSILDFKREIAHFQSYSLSHPQVSQEATPR
jgi:hypothetical protein